MGLLKVIVQMAGGWIGHGLNNELIVASTIVDPPAVRLTIARDERGQPMGGSLGKICGNVSHQDDKENQTEIGLLQFKLDERYREADDPTRYRRLGGEMTLHLQDPEVPLADDATDKAMVEVLNVRADERVVVVKRDRRVLTDLDLGGVSGGSSSLLRSPSGQFELELQNDGNFVIYNEWNRHTPIYDSKGHVPDPYPVGYDVDSR